MNFFSGYTKFIEKENEQLKLRIESLEARNQELVLALFTKASILLPNPPKAQKHIITHGDDNKSAKCSCGWNFASTEPSEVQQSISNHYRSATAPLGRTVSWSTARQKLENQGESNEN